MNNLTITDGAVLVLDANARGKDNHLLIRRTLQQRVRTVLFVNKLDKCILGNGEAIYQQLQTVIEDVNSIVSEGHSSHI